MTEFATSPTNASEAVQTIVDRHVAEGKELGIHVVAYHQGIKIVDCVGGVVAPDSDRLVDADTLFNVFSVSKAITDVALWIQIERGLVALDAPVADYWPEFAQNGKAGVTVAHVLYHRSGVPHMPDGTTPERICDWHWVTREIARLAPIYEPGTRGAYQCMTQGWMLGEVIRRTDPQQRSYRQFAIDEIATPLGAPDLHHGIPEGVEHRIATLHEPEKSDYWASDSLFRRSIPEAVDLGEGVFERPDVRRAVIPSTGGIFSARSEARFWAMLAEKGELDGARILKRETVESFVEPLPFVHEPDPVILMPYIPIGKGGIWYGSEFQPAVPARTARTLIKPGYGHSIGIADLDNRLAVAICHNRIFNPHTIEDCHNTPIIDAIRDSLGITY